MYDIDGNIIDMPYEIENEMSVKVIQTYKNKVYIFAQNK